MEIQCADCGQSAPKPKTGKRLYCKSCAQQRKLSNKRDYQNKWIDSNREYNLEKKRERHQRLYSTPEYKAIRNANIKTRKESLKQEIYNHYGQQCSCCKEKRIEFLCIDHINGGGNKHRKEIGCHINLYRWIVKNNFPDILRILCFNCNQARGFYGYCPHEKERL